MILHLTQTDKPQKGPESLTLMKYQEFPEKDRISWLKKLLFDLFLTLN